MRPEKYRFSLVTFAKLELEEPCADSWYHMSAINILNAPRGKEEFVIVETYTGGGDANAYVCHFYRSELELRVAFNDGLRRRVNSLRGKTPEDGLRAILKVRYSYLKPSEETFPDKLFAEQSGFLKTILVEDFRVPWFFARTGQRIKGDWVINPYASTDK